MKAYSQITLYCLLFTIFLYANNSQAQIGIKAGAGFSDIVFSDEGQIPYLGYEVNYLTHRNPLFSYQFGIFGTVGLNQHFDFQPELLVARQGLNYNIDFLHDNVIYRLHIWYLQMPLLFRFKMSLKKKSHPILFLGPYGALKLKAAQITEYDGNQDEENMSNVRNTDFGLTFGFGYDFELPKGEIKIDLRANYSLVNMMNYIDGHIPDYYGPEKERARNVSLILVFGYQFANFQKNQK